MRTARLSCEQVDLPDADDGLCGGREGKRREESEQEITSKVNKRGGCCRPATRVRVSVTGRRSSPFLVTPVYSYYVIHIYISIIQFKATKKATRMEQKGGTDSSALVLLSKIQDCCVVAWKKLLALPILAQKRRASY